MKDFLILWQSCTPVWLVQDQARGFIPPMDWFGLKLEIDGVVKKPENLNLLLNRGNSDFLQTRFKSVNFLPERIISSEVTFVYH